MSPTIFISPPQLAALIGPQGLGEVLAGDRSDCVLSGTPEKKTVDTRNMSPQDISMTSATASTVFASSAGDALTKRGIVRSWQLEPAYPIAPATYSSYALSSLETHPRLRALPPEIRRDMRVVAHVLPFKTNNYVLDKLVDWESVPNDPIFVLTLPQRGMLREEHFARMAALVDANAPAAKIKNTADAIRRTLNPHPAGQMHYAVTLEGDDTAEDNIGPGGIQHKYPETALFFPAHGQTCHQYCTFCFRWPQFSGMKDHRFSEKDSARLVKYLAKHAEITNVLFTGGDPMFMRYEHLRTYVEPLLKADLPNLQFIRFGTKALASWPYRFVTDPDADDVLGLFDRIERAGKHVSVMAHFNHPRELSTDMVCTAIRRIRNTGAQIRTQSPLLAHINDTSEIWKQMWRQQVRLGLIPYYMFVARDTGAQHYFGIPLARAWEIYRDAVTSVSGLARTVRGPSMSMSHGKVDVVGIQEIGGEKVFVLRMLQAVNPAWAMRPFFAKFNPDAIWIDDLEPYGESQFPWQKTHD